MSSTVCFYMVIFAAVAAALNNSPAICAWSPVLPLEAGSVFSARIHNPWAKRCQAVLRFGDSTFLPITWVFEPINCLGSEEANFTVPPGVPNGDAYIEWDCAGDNALFCVHVMLANGTASLDSTSVQQVGTIGCVSNLPMAPTTLATRVVPTGSLPITTQTIDARPNSQPPQSQSPALSTAAGSEARPSSPTVDVVASKQSNTMIAESSQATLTTTGLPLSTISATQPQTLTGNKQNSMACGDSAQLVTMVTTISTCQPPTHS